MKRLSVILCAAAVIAAMSACGSEGKMPEGGSSSVVAEAEESVESDVSHEDTSVEEIPETESVEAERTESSVPAAVEAESNVPAVEEAESVVPAADEAPEVPAAAADGPLTEEEVAGFGVTAYAEAAEGFCHFDDFAETIAKDLTGTWYNPEDNVAIRLQADGTSYLYYPDLSFYGDIPYKWEYVDRSERGLCPELIIDIYGVEGTGLVYYTAGVREQYFWCCSQRDIFYKQ